MNQGFSVMVSPVRDLDRAKTIYKELLGKEPYADWPARTQQEVKDVGGRKLTATVGDGDGNVFGLIQVP